MIPDISSKEWKLLILGEIQPKIESFSLQMKVRLLSTSCKNGFLSMDKAVVELYDLCVKYEQLFKNDLEKIFPENK